MQQNASKNKFRVKVGALSAPSKYHVSTTKRSKMIGLRKALEVIEVIGASLEVSLAICKLFGNRFIKKYKKYTENSK